ncbi:MAG: hypothetical protein RMM17_07680 [Acidobacteriota bacterium]|nr:hypothetical protein [Blastocatellia bacterium]MDW8412546.1 hypothetical protein [Acidobacteriota bacterium]
MKVCLVCQKKYPDNLQFCSRDGSLLKDSSDASYCKLCDKFYTAATRVCPVHGEPISQVPSEGWSKRTRKMGSFVPLSHYDRMVVSRLAIAATLVVAVFYGYSLFLTRKKAQTQQQLEAVSVGQYIDLAEQQSEINSEPKEVTSSTEHGSSESKLRQDGSPVASTAATSSSQQAAYAASRMRPDLASLPEVSSIPSKSERAKPDMLPNESVKSSHRVKVGTQMPAAETTEALSREATEASRVAVPDDSRRSVQSQTERLQAKPQVLIMNKRRQILKDGYVYEFDLLIDEAYGVRWQSISGLKVTYGGHSTSLSSQRLEPTSDGRLRCHVTVKLEGQSVEDHYGQLYITVLGIDIGNRNIRFDTEVLLDDSFPMSY